MQQTLRRETLSDQVADHLATLIVDQQITPGDLLPSGVKLAQRFGVSRPIIREALASLEARGVIKVANGIGAIVQPLTSEPLRAFFDRAVQLRSETLIELLEVRKGIEVQSAILAAERRTADDVASMADVVAGMRQYLRTPERYTDLDAELHLLIAAASGNAMLYHLVESIRGPLKASIREGLRLTVTDDQYHQLQVVHDRLFEAIERGDAHAAGLCMTQHFDGAVTALVHATLGSETTGEESR